jgi:hypothetical protein
MMNTAAAAAADHRQTGPAGYRNEPGASEANVVGQIVPAQEAAGGLFGLIPAQKDPKIIPAQEDPKRRELREALLAVAADYKDPQTVNPKRLGKWLERMHKNVSGDHKLLRESSSQGHVRWQIKHMSKQGEQQHDFSAF